MLTTRFTERFALAHPVALAPMAGAAGGALAAAVARAGGLGLIGGGYGDAGWLAAEWDKAGDAPIGAGFITWSLTPAVLAAALERRPRAVMLSFGDPAPFAPAIHAAAVTLICQCQSLDHVRAALDAGARVIVAQGAEAGGHGQARGTMSLVPEVADHLAAHAPDTLLLAAGGIADGRGLAAALMLGADGALVGTRFWAATEALVPPGFHAAALAATGDATIRSQAPDAARRLDWPAPFTIRLDWPAPFTIRTLRSAFTDRWAADPGALRAPGAANARAAWAAAQAAGDAADGSAIAGEAVGLIRSIDPAAVILHRIAAEAEACLSAFSVPKYPGGSPATGRTGGSAPLTPLSPVPEV